jgi:ankyrin repeat protein
MLRAGADPNAPDESGALPLHMAAAWGSPAMVEELLRHGADPHLDDGWGEPLHEAAEGGRADVVVLLLAAGAYTDHRRATPSEAHRLDDRATPLHLAVEAGSAATAATLLAKGAAVNLPDCDGCTPLDWLHLSGPGSSHDGLLALLLAYGATPGEECMGKFVRGEVPPTCENLVYAVRRGHLPSVRALLAAGAPVTAADDRGESVLDVAAGLGRIRIVQVLLRAGAPLGEEHGDPLWCATYHGHAAVVRVLLTAGAVPSPSTVVAAARAGRVGILRGLLAAGGDPNARGGEYRFALDAAIHPREEWDHGHPSVVQVLLDAGAKFTPESGNSLGEALARAAEVDARVESSPDAKDRSALDQPDEEGFTPLMWAARGGCSATVDLLLRVGVSPYRTDRWGRTAEDLARETGETDIAARIRSHIERAIDSEGTP